MPIIRAFIAIHLPATIQFELDKISSRIEGMVNPRAIRRVAARNIHLTLKFLGDVSTDDIELLRKLLQSGASHFPNFEIGIVGTGAFPTVRRPRVVWIGVEAQKTLNALQEAIDIETVKVGYASEGRPFFPHLTLARISQNASDEDVRRIGEVIAGLKIGIIGKFQACEVHLMRSELNPGGAVYSSLYAAPLAHE
jgi:2'-5' RNA ligase